MVEGIKERYGQKWQQPWIHQRGSRVGREEIELVKGVDRSWLAREFSEKN